MERTEIENIYKAYRDYILKNAISTNSPSAIMLGGQPASGKSFLTERVIQEYKDTSFFIINGDNYRIYHPYYKEENKNPLTYSVRTHPFSNVFTENLIKDCAARKYNIIIEGTM